RRPRPRPSRDGRDRPSRQRRTVRCRRRDRHGRRRDPRGRSGVPDGRRPATAAAGAPRTPRRRGHDAGTARSPRVVTTATRLRSTFGTGYRHAGLGYTTAMEAAMAPLAARHAHAELDDTPIIDAGCFVLLGNDDYLLRQIAAGETTRARDYAAWLLGVTRGYA